MRLLAVVGLASVLACTVAQAQAVPADLTEACHTEARRLVLSGEGLVEFMKKCTAGQVSLTPADVPQKSCAESAKLMSGEENKVNFIRECAESNSAGGP